MNNVIDLREEKERAEMAASYWRRRQAAQIVAVLPDDINEALAVLQEAADIIKMPPFKMRV